MRSNKSMRRADRLFQIVQHLRARRLTTAAQLAQWLGTSERTIYRDVRDLSLSGVPVQGEAGVGYRIDKAYELTPLMFTRDEVEAVVVGVRMVQAFGGPSLRAAAQSALNKVILALPDQRRAETEAARLFAPVFNQHRPLDDRLDLMRGAIGERQKLRVVYVDEKQARSERVIRPLGLYFWGSSWTLAAWCETRDDFRHFRLDRIETCETTGEIYPEEPEKSLDEFIRLVTSRKGHPRRGDTSPNAPRPSR